MTTKETQLQLKNVTAGHQGKHHIKDITFHIQQGDIACILGPSGCGKTTLLRTIAGFQPILEGEINIKGQTVTTPEKKHPPEKRQIGMVFQDFALFPHLTVEENITFGLKTKNKIETQKTLEPINELLQLQDLQTRYIHQLSGGQQQRIAIARALAPNPKLILMDEPFSSLDNTLRKQLTQQLRKLLKEQGSTAIIVTHDQEEALTLSDKIGVMNEGKLHQWGPPYQLYHEPTDKFVANFIGHGAFIPGKMKTPTSVETELGTLTGDRAYPYEKNTNVTILIRPDDILPTKQSKLHGTITNKAFKGSNTLYTLTLPSSQQIYAQFPSHHDHNVGEQIPIKIAADHLIAFPN